MLRFLLLALLSSVVFPAAAQVTLPTPLASLPFDLVNGVVVLRNLPFNGRRGDFLLDTGCAYALVVEVTAFPSLVRPLDKAGLGAAGTTPLYELPVTQFELGDVRPPQVAQATSLANLRAAVGPQFLGLIGTGLLRRFEVVIDYAHRRLSLYALGPQQAQARPFTRRDSVAFTLERGWPVTVAFVQAVPVPLLLDTGARDNYLAADLAQALPAGARPTGTQRCRHRVAASRSSEPSYPRSAWELPRGGTCRYCSRPPFATAAAASCPIRGCWATRFLVSSPW